jgi:Flp pilus assembly protein TadD
MEHHRAVGSLSADLDRVATAAHRKPALVFPVLIALVTVAAYLPALRGEFIWDDEAYISDNKSITESRWFSKIWTDYRATPQYYPLVFTSFWIEYRLWGAHTLGYHLVNLALHIASAILLGRLAHRLAIPGAWIAAAIFAVHPVNVETVAWINERKNVLSGLFYFLSLTAYSRFGALDHDAPPVKRNWNWYGLSLVFFVCALLSKTVTASLPAVILVIIWWRRGRWTRTDLAALAPMFVLGASMGLVTAWVERHHVGVAPDDVGLSVVGRLLLAGRVPWFYLSKLLWPAGLTFTYPRWHIDAVQTWQFAFPLALVAVFALLWSQRGRVGRGPLAAALCFVGTLAPALGIFNVFMFRFTFVADHLQYLASVFLIVLFAAIAAQALRRLRPAVATTAIAAMLLALAGLTHAQAGLYQGTISLYTDTIKKNPAAWMTHGNLGSFLARAGRNAEALSHYHEALRIKPDQERIYYNMGVAYRQLGRTADAEAAYARAVRIRPDYPEAQLNLGCLLFDENRPEEAARHLDLAIRADPLRPTSYYNLANALMALGRLEEARLNFRQAIRLKPDYWEAWVNDGGAAWEQGKFDEAVAIHREVLRREPRCVQALVNLGSMLVHYGKGDEGVMLLREAVRISPADIDARIRLTRALIKGGRVDEARAEVLELSRLRPGDPEVRKLQDEVSAARRP